MTCSSRFNVLLVLFIIVLVSSVMLADTRFAAGQAGGRMGQGGQRGQGMGQRGGQGMGQFGGQGGGGGMMKNPEFQNLMAEQKKKGQEFQAAEESEGKEFMQTLSGKSKPEIIEAIRTFKTQVYTKNCEFRETMYNERRAFVENFQPKGNAGGNNTGSGNVGGGKTGETMKAKMLERMAANNEEMKNFFKQKQDENMAFLDKMSADDSVQGEDLMKKLQEFFQSQKADAQSYMQQKMNQKPKAATE
jgi:hypothetical protein